MTRTLWIPSIFIVSLLLVPACARKSQQTPPGQAGAPTPQAQDRLNPDVPPVNDRTATSPTRDFRPAFFDFDSYALREDARAALDHTARVLRDQPDTEITIEGHCDERGTVEYNQALGERRAQAARDYLLAAGCSASKLQVISYGKERPFEQGQNERAWSQNRRAHIVAQ